MSSFPGTQVSQHVTVRFFASAKAATGVDDVRIGLPSGASIADALRQLTAAPGQPLEQVLSRCSFLVNAVSTTDRATKLSDGDVIDVMPPFAGG